MMVLEELEGIEQGPEDDGLPSDYAGGRVSWSQRKFRVKECQNLLMMCTKLVDRAEAARKDPYREVESRRGEDERTRRER